MSRLHMYNLIPRTLQRFFVQTIDGVLSDDIVHQCLHVLRLRNGDQIILLDNTSYEYLVEIKSDRKNELTYTVLEKRLNPSEPSVHVHLFMALLKSMDRFELAVQKAVELGVSSIHPIVTQRTQLKSLRNPSRLEKIIKEASEQSERGILPTLASVEDLASMIKSIDSKYEYIFANETHRSVSSEIPIKGNEIHIIIGPEGGYSDEEIAIISRLATSHSNVHSISLGKRILRAETAAICALSMILPRY